MTGRTLTSTLFIEEKRRRQSEVSERAYVLQPDRGSDIDRRMAVLPFVPPDLNVSRFQRLYRLGRPT